MTRMTFSQFKNGFRHAPRRSKCGVCDKRRMCVGCTGCDEPVCTQCSQQTEEYDLSWDQEEQINFKIFLRLCELCRVEGETNTKNGIWR